MIFSMFKPRPDPPAAPAGSPAAAPPPPPPPSPPRTSGDRNITSPRALKQLGLFFAGTAFFALTATFTRRSVLRKQAAARLKFYSPSGSTTIHTTAAREGVSSEVIEQAAAASTKEQPQGSLLAAEALNLATFNVVSFFAMVTGGLSWGLDISSIEDLQAYARRHRQSDGVAQGMTDEEAEKEMEMWMAKLLVKKDEILGAKTVSEDVEAKAAAEGKIADILKKEKE